MLSRTQTKEIAGFPKTKHATFEGKVFMQDEVLEIHVRLLDEGTGVWKPVKAKRLPGASRIFEILEQDYDRSIEKWEFEPGETVQVEERSLSEGTALVATRKSSPRDCV